MVFLLKTAVESCDSNKNDNRQQQLWLASAMGHMIYYSNEGAVIVRLNIKQRIHFFFRIPRGKC